MMKNIAGVITLFGIFSYLYLVQIILAWGYTVDDMFITLRYANHLALGHGIVWNIGAPPIEGYSNFSYLLLGTLAIKLNLSPILTLKIVGALSLLVSVAFLYALTRLWLKPRYAIIPPMWLLFYKGEILWAVSGLETVMYQCLIIASLYFLLRGLGYNTQTTSQPQTLWPKHFFLSGLLLSLAGITRPDMPALFIAWLLGLIITFYLLPNDYPSRDKRRVMLLFVLTVACIYGSYFLWRWNYFGQLFPNSFYCKWLTGANRGTVDRRYLILALPFLLLSMPYLFRVTDRRKLFLLLPSAIYLILLYDSDTVMSLNNRHFLACFILLLPLSLLGIQQGLSHVGFKVSSISKQFITYLIALYVAILFIPHYNPTQLHHKASEITAANAVRHQLSQWLNTSIDKNKAIVMGDCGIVGFFSDNPIIDSYCLNNKRLTTAPVKGAVERFVEWVFSQEKPQTIIISKKLINGVALYPFVDALLINHPSFQQHYYLKRVFKLPAGRDDYGYYAYQRKKSAKPAV